MDPVGPQGKIKSNEQGVMRQKNIDRRVGVTDGGLRAKSGTRGADTPKMDSKWQGKTKGKTTHTYGVGGRNDED